MSFSMQERQVSPPAPGIMPRRSLPAIRPDRDRKDDIMSPKRNEQDNTTPVQNATEASVPESTEVEGATPEAETAEEQPKVKAPKPGSELAALATQYLDRDKVTPSQARSYTELLGDSPLEFSVLANYDRETLEKVANKTAALSKEDAASLRVAYSGLTPSHQWMKAIVATALALDDAKQVTQVEAEEGTTPPEQQDEVLVETGGSTE